MSKIQSYAYVIEVNLNLHFRCTSDERDAGIVCLADESIGHIEFLIASF